MSGIGSIEEYPLDLPSKHGSIGNAILVEASAT
jgi:hypothetical protein